MGALLSLPVRRLGGIWVAIATLAFASFFDAVVVRLPFVGGGDTSLLQGTRVPRPVIGPWDLADDKAFLVLALVVFALVAAAVIQIRRGHGRAHPPVACGAARWRPSRSGSPRRAPG